MLRIVFKNLEPSQLARNVVKDRIEPVLEKFPALGEHRVTLTLEMENSPTQAGLDLFTVTSIVSGPTFKNLKLRKSAENFYQATAELVDAFSELLSQETDRRKKIFRSTKLANGGSHE